MVRKGRFRKITSVVNLAEQVQKRRQKLKEMEKQLQEQTELVNELKLKVKENGYYEWRDDIAEEMLAKRIEEKRIEEKRMEQEKTETVSEITSDTEEDILEKFLDMIESSDEENNEPPCAGYFVVPTNILVLCDSFAILKHKQLLLLQEMEQFLQETEQFICEQECDEGQKNIDRQDFIDA